MKTPITITKVESFIIDLPTIRPHKLSMTTMQKQSMVIIKLYSSDGLVGIGEATTIGGLSYGEESPEGIKLTIDKYLAPALINIDATNIQSAMTQLSKIAKGNRLSKSAIETALFDAQGKRLNVSMATLLGGAVTDTLPVLWTLASGKTEQDIDEAEKLLAIKRHNTFKLKIGSREPAVDIAHVSAIKKALGNRAKVTVDVNQAWSESTAKTGIAALQDAGVDLIEQPIVKENHRGLARLREKFIVPIMADEAVATPEDAFDLACLGAADVFALKIAKSGGPMAVLKVAAIGEAAGIALYGGTLLEGSIGSIASAQAFSTLRSLEWGTELFGPLLLTDDIVANPPEFSNYQLKLPSGPGLGLELDMDKLKHYQRRE
ncbi:MAG: muconate/chloromuconate family cycloisomerase [Bacteriovoracaceae bacterium]|nr:muconate/chloromuconate family cycloisomerase [Bacteriovoracaceae bacterium]